MAILTRAEVENPDAVVVRLTIAMPVKEWRQVQTALTDHSGWPFWTVVQTITDGLMIVDRKADEEVEAPDHG